MTIIGIDPGSKGGIAIISNIANAYPYDDGTLDSLCKMKKDAIVYVEQVHAMRGQGVTSMFNFGKSAGKIEGILIANNMEYHYVTPQRWKKEFGLIGTDKNASIEMAKELFPNVNLKRTKRCRKEDDGMAEALLIAEYGRKHESENEQTTDSKQNPGADR